MENIGANMERQMAQIDSRSFDPETIALLRKTLVEAEDMIPREVRSSEIRVKLASGILAAAAEGERDPSRLRSAGLRSIDNRVEAFTASWLD